MVMKDISAIDELERTIRSDPTVLPEVTHRLYEQLADSDPSSRMDAGRSLRAAAEHDPELAKPHLDTLVDLLESENGSLQLSGAIGLAEVASVAPGEVAEAVPSLLDTFEDTVAPTIEEAVVRALTRIGLDNPTVVTAADEILAARLETATFPVQTAIVKLFVGVVREAPAQYPEIIQAYKLFLVAETDIRARFAADALARVARADASVISDIDRIRSQVEKLEAQFDADPRHGVGDDVKEAARTFRHLTG
jgi:hypothetical protein